MSEISEAEKNEIHTCIDKKFNDYLRVRLRRIDKDSYKYDSLNALVRTVIEPADFKIEHFKNYTA
ncbi:hypothetical protein RMB13_02055 [Acinetobacter sp. V102_4]|uniref:hypothetical protein n=1 Tax=Acinetobacter sp. V102_4 TaxID=3072984 RepID=UPI00287D89F6|nr:hypothetical protein [Acinetobacter sp. V102_4]MDS7928276.1 hypothetical protein [Acinetobacter sp. V102_4]